MQISVATIKPRIITIVVVGILVLSIAATAVAAIDQVVGEERTAPPVALASGEQDGEVSFISGVKFVCPFH